MLLPLLKSMSFVAIMRMGGIGLQLVWFMLLVRYLPLEAVGVYSVVNTFWILIRALGPLGNDSALIREGGPLAVSQDHAGIRGLLALGIRNSLAINAVCFTVAVLAVHFFLRATLPLTPLALVAIWCGAFGYLLFGFYSSSMLVLERQIAAHALESLCLPIGIILVSGALYWVDALNLESLIVSQAVIAILLCLFYAVIARRYLGNEKTPVPPEQKRQFRALSWRLMGTLAFNNINVRLPVLLSPFLIGTAGTALLETAVRFAALLGIIQWCAGFVIGPKLSKAGDDKPALQQLLILGCWIVFLPACALYLFFMFAGGWMLELLASEEYRAAHLPLLLVALGYLINTASGPTNHYYMMLGRERESFRISAAETVFTVVLLVTLGLSFGLWGMSAAIALGLSFRNFWLNWRLYPLTGLHSGIWSPQGWQGIWKILRDALR